MDSDNRPVMVTIHTLVYNHELYLRDCLNGIVMQKTNFRFEAVVHEDCSTDHSADILREYAEKYPEIIKPIYETENQYSKGKKLSQTGPKMNALTRGKYIALCEGDDYWTDPNKLQRQVDFLESHPDYSMCFHAVNIDENGNITTDDSKGDEEIDFSTEDMIKGGGGFCGTCSIMYRVKYPIHTLSFQDVANIGDYPLQIRLSLEGKIHYIPNVMGVYRYNHPGSWTSRAKNKNKGLSINFNDYVWMKELDRYTNYKYHETIYSVFVKYDTEFIKAHRRNIFNLANDIKETHQPFMKALKQYILIIADIYFPKLLHLYAKARGMDGDNVECRVDSV